MANTFPTAADASPPSASDVAMALKSLKMLSPALAGAPESARVLVAGPHQSSEPVPIPAAAARMLLTVLAEMAEGNAVSLIPQHADLTSQQAANLLNVSRPYLVRLLDEGKIPFHRTGTHRRVRVKDALEYKAEHRRLREAALDRLSDLDQELGLI